MPQNWTVFNPIKIQELADFIKEQGLLEPIVVVKRAMVQADSAREIIEEEAA